MTWISFILEKLWTQHTTRSPPENSPKHSWLLLVKGYLSHYVNSVRHPAGSLSTIQISINVTHKKKLCFGIVIKGEKSLTRSLKLIHTVSKSRGRVPWALHTDWGWRIQNLVSNIVYVFVKLLTSLDKVMCVRPV